jgi:plasmid stabilization system protein ParE
VTRSLILRKQARREFDEATDWYEQRRAGLGSSFVRSVETVLREIRKHPARYPWAFRDIREALVPGFPYCVYYREDPAGIVVLSVFHTSRNPAIWQSRR